MKKKMLTCAFLFLTLFIPSVHSAVGETPVPMQTTGCDPVPQPKPKPPISGSTTINWIIAVASIYIHI